MSAAAPARLGAFYFAYFCYLGAFGAYFSLWLVDRGFSPAQISLVLAVPQLLRMFAPGVWGWLADRTGARRTIVIVSSALAAGCFATLAFADSLASVLLIVAAMGLFSSGVLPLVEATTLAVLAGRPGSYGPVRLWGSVGFIASLLGVGALLDVRPVAWLVPVVFGLMAAAFATSLGLPSVPPQHADAPRARLGPVLRQGRVMAFFAACFCMSAAHGALYAFYSIHLVQHGYSKTLVGVMWTVGVVAEIGVFLALPWLFGRFSHRMVLAVSFAAAALRFAAIGWGAASVAILVAAQLLHALTFGTYHAAAVAVVHRLFPGPLQVRGQALYASLSYGLGGMVGMLLAGWLWQSWGPEVTFTASALFGVAGCCLAALTPAERTT
ncbi:MAG: MFS transporter [Betaproteobacteria bacterium]|nr:MFS transporter [Betaproteobacteria bacterium]